MNGPTYKFRVIAATFPPDVVKIPKAHRAGGPPQPKAEGEPPFVDLFRKLDLNPQGPKDIDGGTQYDMLCLRDHTHSVPGDPTGMWATFWPDGGLRYWGCRHAHCDGLLIPDWVALARERGLDVPNLRPPAGDSCGDLWGIESIGDDKDVKWPDPLPLVSKVEPEPYPVDALPGVIGAAVEEVQTFVQAPISLVASSALAAVSLAVQAHWDIKRADKLSGPTSLFLVTIAESGERKSSCDGFFTTVIREYEQQQFDEAKPRLSDYRSDRKSWEAKCKGVEEGIRAASKSGKDTQALEQTLRELGQDEPKEPRFPRLLYSDATPESLKWNLATKWPSAGVLSSEAGIVLGSHGMGSESVMRNMALFNLAWDGTDIQTERRTSESFTVRGARLTMFLQVQEGTLRAFMDGPGGLSRDIGFLARCLIAWPESTIGSRPFQEAPPAWPHLAAFNSRLELILNQPVPIHEDGYLIPGMLALSPEAKTEWVTFHDAVERDLGSGGRFHDVKDVAAKIADNATRLAGLFHVFSGGMGPVSVENMKAGCRVAEWHLTEARRFFGELALPAGLADAARLESWLIKRCKKTGTNEVPTKDVQQFGPTRLRENAKIDAALNELVELGRAQRIKEGRRKFIAVNPSLLAPVDLATAIPAIPATPLPSGPQPPVTGSMNSGFSSSNSENPESLPAFEAVSGESFSEDL